VSLARRSLRQFVGGRHRFLGLARRSPLVNRRGRSAADFLVFLLVKIRIRVILGASPIRDALARAAAKEEKKVLPWGSAQRIEMLKSAKPIQANPSFFLGIILLLLGLAWRNFARF
jgi:hypothetical protein